MKPSQPYPSLRIGALVGALVTTALIAVFFLAAQVAGTPFVPFDVFDWMARVLPGAVITFGIDIIVGLIRTFQLGETSGTAKLAEQIMAVVGLGLTGIVASAVLFEVLRRKVVNVPPTFAGLIAGIVVGMPVTIISITGNRSAEASVFVSGVWIMLAFVAWGLALGWIFQRLTGQLQPATATDTLAAVQPIDRRSFLVQLGGATAAITVVGAGVGSLLTRRTSSAAPVLMAESTPMPTEERIAWSANNSLPNAADTLVPAPGTRSEFTALDLHYRIDINLQPPVVRENEWTLNFSGLIDEPQQMTLAQIRAYEPIHQFVTLACISNSIGGDLIGTQRWTGVSLKTLLADVPYQPNTTYLKISSADSFDEYVSLDLIMQDERVMLAYEWDGLPLTEEHGFPLRIYIPDHYGMKQPKWITDIEFVAAWSEGYWVRRGWDRDALMRATSVIDTVAVDDLVRVNASQFVPIGGIAHAGDRGISKVEVRVDDGEWTEAQLRQPISSTTWVIWRYDWPFEAGDHTFAVRCVEGNGIPQIEEVAGVRPSGATGIDSVRESI